MRSLKTATRAIVALLMTCSASFAAPTAQINIPSTDAKGLAEFAISLTNYARFSNKADAGSNSYLVGV